MKRKIVSVLFLLFAVLMGNTSAFANVGNDTYQTAQSINVNTVYSGMLKGYDDYEDYYKFTLTMPGQVKFNINNISDSSWDFQITDQYGNVYTDGTTDNSNTALGVTERRVGLPAGTYYLKIDDDYNSYNKTYYFAVNFTSMQNIETEFNNVLASANPINTNQDIIGEMQSSGDYDYFKFTLPEDGAITLKMDQKSDVQWDVTILNQYGEVYKEMTTDSSSYVMLPMETTVGLPKGTYYVVIDDDYNASQKPYKFRVNYTKSKVFEKEFNNNSQSANPVTIGTTYTGHLQSYGDVDFYTFKVAGSSTVDFFLSRMPNASWDVTIYDQFGNKKGTFTTMNDQFAKGWETARFNLAAGQYYVSIDNDYNSIDKKYNLLIKGLSPTVRSSSVKVANYVGKSDIITTSSIQKGDIVKVYSASGKYLASSKPAASTYASVAVSQLSTKSGYIYVTLTRSGMSESAKVKVAYNAEPITPKPSASKIKITNFIGSYDKIYVSSLKKGDVVKVYTSKGNLLATSSSVTSTSATISTKQLGTKSGSVYITVKRIGMHESAKVKVAYYAEPVTPKPSTSKITITNYKGKYDKIYVSSLKKGDIVKVYTSKGKLLATSKSVTSTSATISTKQLGTKSGSVYITVKRIGMHESSKVKKTFSAEKR